jgi:uncharacterized protein (TIGR03083 family)
MQSPVEQSHQTSTTSDTNRSKPRQSRLDRDVAMRLARTEYDRFTELLQGLQPSDWQLRTCCPEWDVHAMACHVVGMAEMAASPIESVRQQRAAKKAGGAFIDALTALQAAKHAHRSAAQLTQKMSEVGSRAATGRRRTPALLRRRSIGDQPIEETGKVTEPWTLGYLLDCILTRDTWMHRSDIAAARGVPMTLTADHDGVLVADVVDEWASRHGQPFQLTLSGPAGGTWSRGGGGPVIESDAVDFCRVASGRGTGEGLLAVRVPF